MKLPFENWRDTSWNIPPYGDEKVTIVDVIDYLGTQEAVEINILELTQYVGEPGGIPDWAYCRERVASASLEHPIIIVKSDAGGCGWGKQYRYVLDGNHRLQKAINEKVEIIKAKILDLDNSETPEVFKKIFGNIE